MDSPFPSSKYTPSHWLAATAPPHKKSFGNITRFISFLSFLYFLTVKIASPAFTGPNSFCTTISEKSSAFVIRTGVMTSCVFWISCRSNVISGSPFSPDPPEKYAPQNEFRPNLPFPVLHGSKAPFPDRLSVQLHVLYQKERTLLRQKAHRRFLLLEELQFLFQVSLLKMWDH